MKKKAIIFGSLLAVFIFIWSLALVLPLINCIDVIRSKGKNGFSFMGELKKIPTDGE